ncbi:MAG: hypothetical protein O7J95_01070, partial [Planctomycetota bacterium]|nr:hypothetical protein [Planctomycetota bacterium]
NRAILKRRFFVTQSFRDKQVAALLAMSGVDTVQVREILAEFSQKKKSPLATAARRALKELDTLKQRQAEQPTTGKTSKAGTTRKMTAGKARKKTKKAEVKGV